MFPGHFAAGLALKVAQPRAPMLGLMIGVGVLDLLFGIGVMLDIEGGSFAHFETPWSHSLVMALLWSMLYAAWFRARGIGVAAAMAAAVFSHWLLDLVSHHPDMQLWPYSTVELGYGAHFGGLGGWLEMLITLCGVLAYCRWAWRQRDTRRRWGIIALVMGVALTLEIVVVG
ncbi:hypothetical protein GCM10011395_11840 [Sphingomonas psychrolutea]|uniref:Metal-dependent hydrolase n=2 Tax=Sphingomonas psychrolutea TaxID=1259676 RepID=A0ABQ1GG31_9SPHN|nr:hypothetical protein GCM10011395_11840 [Sphingomonas psychrolutea]